MLRKIYIKNFKSITETTITAEPDYNVWIGANNNGKTSVFEAIHLWKMCYDLNIKQKHDGFYATAHNLLFRNMGIIRVSHDDDIFPYDLKKKDFICTITLTFELGGNNYDLGFIISKPTTIDDAYLQVSYANSIEFVRFANAVAALPNHNLSNVISINESRPVAFISAHEPKMTVAEVREKILRGKSHEVLRNKIIGNEAKISDHIQEVTGNRPSFSSSDKGAYIEMKVDGRDLLSCGSGFIQLAELFSSIEYSNSLIKILLIDEPDAHIHVMLQRKLVDRLKSLTGYQLFIISHNDRFVRETLDSKLFEIAGLENVNNIVTHIDPKVRALITEGLTGIVCELDTWVTAQKIVLVEGVTDRTFLPILLEKYCQVKGCALPTIKYHIMNGIDILYPKLDILTRAMKDVVQPNTKWLLVRDTDCYPISRIPAQKHIMEASVSRGVPFDIYYQNGYGIESTYMTDVQHLAKILSIYYGVPAAEIEPIVQALNSQYAIDVKDNTNRIYKELNDSHFERQKEARQRLYNGIVFQDVINEITDANIQYIMTKPIATWYYEDIDTRIKALHPEIVKAPITINDVESTYLGNILSLDDFYDCHVTMMEQILAL